MFKLIVLAAFMAIAAAAPAPAPEPAPGVYTAPIESVYSSPIVAPTYTSLAYSAPLAYKTLPLTYAAPYHYSSPLAYKAVSYL